MYDDNTRGLEGPERPAESTTTNQRLLADGGTTWGNLSGFQRDCLETIARLERNDETPYGLEIKRQLEPQHGEVNHGRLYPNLDELVQLELVEKSELDKRTNEYALTRDGRGLLIQRVERMAAACGMTTAVADDSNAGDRE
ncbi:helix-turn-helix transcriptional regulator [Halostagnicola sp. A-GB9-2]|uniref:PadR family transcriptional regulator n=1 Tax=Halostagnicola sp. A-GB9-2 TaxID=3048066 RepID=UPI0024BFF6B2|nr:helix-turn-helix transcriptional regulator [Halostagnicola sp. A-GB9-2]MDJ1433052.1 helix-turn-helix transcriptional regulator [Halostagnicola sp. A-GB9-2]